MSYVDARRVRATGGQISLAHRISSPTAATRTMRRAHTRKINALMSSHYPVHGWQQRALCRLDQHDPDIFFPRAGASANAARRVCGRCVVRLECLRAALTNEERFGVWGGLTESERRRLSSSERRHLFTPPRRCAQ